MKYIDNDMDDLFRKAGEDYPLNTDPKKWDDVQAALLQGAAGSITRSGTNYNKYYLLLLLLLIPVAYFIYDNGNGHAKKETTKNILPSQASLTITKKQLQQQEEIKTVNNQPIKNVSVNKKSAVIIEERKKVLHNEATPGLKNKFVVKEEIITGEIKITKEGNSNIRTDEGRMIGWNRFPGTAFNDEAGSPSAMLKDKNANYQDKFPADSSSAKEKKPKKVENKKGWYYGVVAGPDLSTIKYQEVKKAGLGAGILIGYNVGKHWSIEGSAIYSRKKYYTDGKHFDKTAAHIPTTTTVYFLDGVCSMFEFPVAAKYQFTAGNNSFFATAGLNSYIMKRENYDYRAHANGSVYDGYREYKNSGNFLFSNVQLSGGYQFNIFSGTVFRIEPYIQVPLKKVGIGKLPVTSAGLHIGLLRNFR